MTQIAHAVLFLYMHTEPCVNPVYAMSFLLDGMVWDRRREEPTVGLNDRLSLLLVQRRNLFEVPLSPCEMYIVCS